MKALLIVFKNRDYLALGVAVSVIVFALATWLPNIRLLWTVWSDSSVAFVDKIVLAIRLLESISTNFTMLSASYTILIAVLAGINAALMADLIRTRNVFKSGAGVGMAGMFTGMLGVGCAACGSLLLTSLVGTALGISLLAFLPLRGGEFGILGVMLLAYSTYLLAKQGTKPLVCEPELKV